MDFTEKERMNEKTEQLKTCNRSIPDSGHLYFHDERNGQCCDLRQYEFENDLCQDNGKLEPPGL